MPEWRDSRLVKRFIAVEETVDKFRLDHSGDGKCKRRGV
jgi:hypothetical protein